MEETTEQPKKLSVRMWHFFKYEQVSALKKDLDKMSLEEKKAMVEDFNKQGLPTVLE